MGKQYLDKEGLQVIAGKVNEKLKKVVEIPSTAKDGDAILYIGEDTNEFSNGDIYLYHESPFTKNWYCYDNLEGDYLYFEDDPVTTSSSVYNSMNVPPTHEGDLILNEYWHILSVEGDIIHAEYYDNEYELSRYPEYDVTTDGTWEDISQAFPVYDIINDIEGNPNILETLKKYRPMDKIFILHGGPYGDGRYVDYNIYAMGTLTNHGYGRNDVTTWAIYNGRSITVVTYVHYFSEWNETVYDLDNLTIPDNFLFVDDFNHIRNIPPNTAGALRNDNTDFAMGAIVFHVSGSNDIGSQWRTIIDSDITYYYRGLEVGDIIYQLDDTIFLHGVGKITENLQYGNFKWVDYLGNEHTTSTWNYPEVYDFMYSVGSIPTYKMSGSYDGHDYGFRVLYLGATDSNYICGHTYERDYDVDNSVWYWKDISGFEDAEARETAAGAMALAQAAFDNGGSSYTDVYSDTEFKTNKTFNDKPVYRRYINDESRLGNLTYLDIQDVETPIYYYYHFIENNEIVKEVQGLTAKFGFNNNNITFIISNTVGKKAFAALIEYTKTTD